MQGLAAAGAVPAALGILGANYGPGKRKNKVFASFSAGNPIGAAFGLILGGVLIVRSDRRRREFVAEPARPVRPQIDLKFVVRIQTNAVRMLGCADGNVLMRVDRDV